MPGRRARRWLVGILGMTAALHAVGMAANPLPAQDGLKLLRVARQFHSEPWPDVARGSDRHPLYPAMIALAEPPLAAVIGRGPDSWRIAAQGVSAIASMGLVMAVGSLARRAFASRRIGLVAALIAATLPVPATLGHDTLSDIPALALFATALAIGLKALQSRSSSAFAVCGAVAGLGYLARPEAALAVVAVGVAWLLGRHRSTRPTTASFGLPIGPVPTGMAAMVVALGSVVGSYALVKGEVSEKLAMRIGVGLGGRPAIGPRSATHGLPGGLDDPRLDFAPKEESGHPSRLSIGSATGRLVGGWAEGVAWIGVPLALWGFVRCRSRPGWRLLSAVVAAGFAIVLVRHATQLGYLSPRHTLAIVVATVPWVAAGVVAIVRRLARRSWCGPARARRIGLATAVLVVAAAIVAQARPGHPSRWGHREAGAWLAANAGSGEAVLDTRGWAAFVSGVRSYDMWHVRQALSDARLAYVVVGADELAAPSARAATLKAVLAHAATPAASFPERAGGVDPGVLVYRFRRPESWEGLLP